MWTPRSHAGYRVAWVGGRPIPDIFRAIEEGRLPVLPLLDDVLAGQWPEVSTMVQDAFQAPDYLLPRCPDHWGGSAFEFDAFGALTCCIIYGVNGADDILHVDTR
jgi:hypothetical protein